MTVIFPSYAHFLLFNGLNSFLHVILTFIFRDKYCKSKTALNITLHRPNQPIEVMDGFSNIMEICSCIKLVK